jgi:Recombination endonuclease VII
MKKCRRCGLTKEEALFVPKTRRCRDCHAAYCREYGAGKRTEAIASGTKACRTCHKEKGFSEFQRMRSGYFVGQCRSCKTKENRARASIRTEAMAMASGKVTSVEKKCCKCKVTKPIAGFGFNRSSADGLAGECRACRRDTHADYFSDPANVEKMRRWHEKYRADNPGMKRIQALKARYGLTVERYDGMYQKQEGRCAICGTHASELRKGLVVDHDHATGVVRALLCYSCNFAVGHLKDSPALARKTADYLQSHAAEATTTPPAAC